jgi:hypothetical protein
MSAATASGYTGATSPPFHVPLLRCPQGDLILTNGFDQAVDTGFAPAKQGVSRKDLTVLIVLNCEPGE